MSASPGIDVAVDSLAARGRVGYVPEDAPLYDGLRVVEFLHFMAAIKGVGGHAARGAVNTTAWCGHRLGIFERATSLEIGGNAGLVEGSVIVSVTRSRSTRSNGL
jgi:hypothetical protein